MQPLFIGPYTQKSGVKQDVTPFMIPDEAFPNMLNAFVWRGRVQRKPGYELLGRLRRVLLNQNLGSTDLAGALSGNLLNYATAPPNNDAGAILAPGSIIITVAGAPNQVFTEPATPNGTLIGSPGTGTGTINYLNGNFTIQTNPVLAAAAVTAAIGYYPSLPAMGIRLYEDPTKVNQERTIFWDTKYAYRYNSVAAVFEELPSIIPSVWTGTDSQQFWTTNFQNTPAGVPYIWETNGVPTGNGFIVTSIVPGAGVAQINTSGPNTFLVGDVVVFFQMSATIDNAKFFTVTIAGNPFTVADPGNVLVNATGMVYLLSNTDGIRYYDGTPAAETWVYFTPALDGNISATPPILPTTYLLGALLIVPYKNRLVVLNTVEGTSLSSETFPQRARWSQLGLATGAAATDVINGWTVTLPGRGNLIDAATEESIVSCGFVKDELIVYFERSTWKLFYTGNEIGPFSWQRIDSELGADSTFSNVQFDDGLVALGNVGVHVCNGSQVKRIDQNIPNEVFDIHNGSDGPKRVSAARDFFLEIVYFAYPLNIAGEQTGLGKIFFPNKMMIYNYQNNTFSFFNDNATTLGYFSLATGKTWAQLTNFTWNNWTSPWGSGVLSEGFPSVCFGNQQGFIERYRPTLTGNGASLMIQNIVPSVFPNPPGSVITSRQHNLFMNQYVRVSNALGVGAVNGINARVIAIIDENNFIITPIVTGTYTGNGVMTVLTNIIIPTKQFTPYWEKGKNYSLKYMDVLFSVTTVGELQTDVFIDFSTSQSMTDTSSGSVLGNSVISTAREGTNLPYYQFQNQGAQIWKRFYTVATGETFQIQFSFSDQQMVSQLINESNVVIHAMNMFFEESGEFY
jgi:hypothetical protein